MGEREKREEGWKKKSKRVDNSIGGGVGRAVGMRGREKERCR